MGSILVLYALCEVEQIYSDMYLPLYSFTEWVHFTTPSNYTALKSSISSIQFSRSVVSDSLRPHESQQPVHHQLLEFTQSHVHWVSDAIKPSPSCRPILLSIRVFSNESALYIRCPKYWSFSFNISPSSEHSGPISFRMDWFFPYKAWLIKYTELLRVIESAGININNLRYEDDTTLMAES